VYEYPVVAPDRVGGVRACGIDLNGTWEFSGAPGREFWTDTSAAGWMPIQVPGEPMMQGFAIRHDVEYGYRNQVPIPPDFSGKRVILRFNGVYSDARVWVNGRFVRAHHGGFTSWDCDITPDVEPGRTARVVVGFRDRFDEISFGSGYAKHPIGGILRSVQLLALPDLHLRQLLTTVRFDSAYRNATLAVTATLDRGGAATLELSLSDPSGVRVPLRNSRVRFLKTRPRSSALFHLDHPLHWTAEHPRLYTLHARLLRDGTMAEEATQRVGFREIRVRGNKLYVNGMPVKLRGACRHDIHPTQGRSTTSAQDRQDVILAKAANMNFIRTSHYPPSQEFLDCCDEYGLYVEEETAVCFVGTHRPEPYQSRGASQNDSSFTDRYLSQLSEMIGRDRHHPSVIIWSIGNENQYGRNFQAEYAFVKSIDRSRPVMFSYPGYVPKDTACYDIASIHYVGHDGHANQLGIEIKDFGSPAMPVLHDEWAHVACYNTPTLRSDPNVRNFWGESVKRVWDGCFASDGGAGGAIWGFIDEVFMLPDSVVGYGPWGIVDVWRRKKPEFWLTRKAYSPVRVEQTRFVSYRPGDDLVVPLENRFDHTNLNELRIRLTAGELSRTVAAPDIPPHARGFLTLPAGVLTGNRIGLEFMQEGETPVDHEMLTLGAVAEPSARRGRPLRISEGERRIVAESDSFSFAFDKTTGLLEDASVGGRRVIVGGPFLHLTSGGGKLNWAVDSLLDLPGNKWERTELAIRKSQDDLSVSVRGHAGDIEVDFTIMVTGNGEIRTSFDLAGVPERWREVGIRYVYDRELTTLSWERNALWSVYPADHIGRPVGVANKTAPASQRDEYRVRPTHPWSWDTRDYFLDGKTSGRLPVPVDFRSTKEHIVRYALTDPQGHRGACVNSDGTLAARAVVDEDGSTSVILLSRWNYVNLSWGNYEGVKPLPRPFHGEATIQLLPGEDER
jgi:hypothetical protein